MDKCGRSDPDGGEVSPHLKKMLLLIVSNFYPVEDLYLIKLLILKESLTETALKQSLQYDIKTLRNRLQALEKDRILCHRRAGDPGGNKVGIDEYYINYGMLRNIVAFKLVSIRRDMEAKDSEGVGKRRWHRKETWFGCLNCKRKYHSLYIAQITHPRFNRMMCTFCMGPVEEIGIEFPTTMNLREFNEGFKEMYELLKLHDEWKPPASPNASQESGPKMKRLKTSNKVTVNIIQSLEEEAIVPKEVPSWFQE